MVVPQPRHFKTSWPSDMMESIGSSIWDPRLRDAQLTFKVGFFDLLNDTLLATY